MDSVLLQDLLEFGKPGVAGFERSDQRLLVLVDPPSIRFLHGQFRARRDNCLCFRVDEMLAKRIGFLVTNGHTDIIKPYDPVQLPHQRAKEILRIAMRSDSIRYADERFVSRGRGKPSPLCNFLRVHPAPPAQLSPGALDVGIPAYVRGYTSIPPL